MSNLIKSRYICVDENVKKINSESTFQLLSGSVVKVAVNEMVEEQDGSEGDELADGMEVLDMQKLVAEEEELLTNKANAMLEEAREAAAKILQDAEEEAKRIRQLASEEGKRLGYMEGMELGQNEIKAMEQQLQMQIEEKERELEVQISSLEPQFAEVVCKLLEHLTGVVAEENKEVIIHLIHSAISKVKKNKVFIVKVSKQDYEFVASKEALIYEGLPEDYDIHFIEDGELDKNQCIIETDGTFIDCSLDVQLKNLIMDLKMLASM